MAYLLSFSHSFIFAFSGSLLIQTFEIPLIASAAHLILFTSDTDFLLVLNFLSKLNVNSWDLSLSCHHWQWAVLVLLVIWQELQISSFARNVFILQWQPPLLPRKGRWIPLCLGICPWVDKIICQLRGSNTFQHPKLVWFILSSGCSILFPF